ncbi:MAG: tetratricopeptide repeat protein [Gemmatimonadaceae bacterium]|nr:tetratricopeptide repeat protein [Gemmatimonadaceae bacterium]
MSPEQADKASQTALDLDPDLAEAHSARGLSYSLSKRYDQAQEEFEIAMKLDPKLYEAPYFYARACLAQGKSSEAAPLFERAAALRPEDYHATTFLASAYTAQGRIGEASKASHRAVRAIEGLREEALQCLERAIDKGYGHREWVEHDSDLNSLRTDRRFQALLDRI